MHLREDYSMPFEIPTMELKLNNLCNLKCRMCHPGDSTSWNDWAEVKDFYKKENNIIFDLVEENNLERKPFLDKFQDNPAWWASLEKLLPYFRRVEFAGGEPLMDPQHYNILDMLAPYGHQIEIKYATNLSMLGKGDRNIYEYWPKFRSIAVNVSVDGYKNSYEYIRGNAKWDTLIQNIKEVQKISNISRIVGAMTVQVSNIMDMDKLVEYFLDDLGIIFHTHRVSYPQLLSIQTLPNDLKIEVINRLRNISNRVDNFKLVKQRPELLKYTRNQIEYNINFIQTKDLSSLWKDTVEFNKRLDLTRNQSFIDVTPEFKSYV
jgi:MoaA/NifB/PqqE/SkfB family radical SAM enzyme